MGSCRKDVQQLLVQYAAKLNVDDAFQRHILEQNQHNRAEQGEVFGLIKAIRDL